jgi:hypothetical protein
MSVQEIKQQIAELPRSAQDELVAFLFYLRHVGDAGYQGSISRRLDDTEPSNWLSPDEFERKLDKTGPP